MKRIVTAAFIAAFSATPMFAASRTIALKVSGMTCPACPITVKKVLKRIEGVTGVEVNYPKKEVVVTFDTAKTSEKALVKATSEIGFPSQPIERDK